MSKQQAENCIGCFIWLANVKCKIIAVDSFGGELHFGIQWADGKGWVPVKLAGQPEW